MDRSEIRGLIKGLGIAFIVSAAIFYSVILNMRVDYKNQVISQEEVVRMAREKGMIYINELSDVDLLTKDHIIELAKSYGMDFVEATTTQE